ncbi:MAG: TMEM165/GDT1 family protein [Leptolyngbyaceae cyanobacterium CAN_BIN12]|nr:TMEM165/GDT1 family protein [Leptolyngbyaceae cyanobacterium CAN_BIN12]
MTISNPSLQAVQLLEGEQTQPDMIETQPLGLVIEAEQGINAAIAPSSETSPAKPPISAWKVFTSTFITIFLAELGDKTQVSTLLMSAEFHNPWVIFAGAGTALILTTLIGVWVGQWLSSRLSPRTLDVAAGIILALISAWLVWDVARM